MTTVALTDVRHAQIEVGAITMHVAEAGEGEPVVLLHGFPELWYSWRHQLRALADAGYRAIAPDQRGFGKTSAPEGVDHYDALTIVGDLIGLLDTLGLDQAVVVGHDWGALIAWYSALLYPDRVRAVGALSVPYGPRTPVPPMAFFREVIGDDFYMLWLQEPGVADAAFAADIRRALAGAWVFDREGWRERPVPDVQWRSSRDEAVYMEALTRTGFTPGLNWYRNFDRNWELLAPYDGRTIDQPAFFIVGSEDPVTQFMPADIMDGVVTDLRDVTVLDGVNHWIAQEKPIEVNAMLLRFLEGLRP